jgi:hypothetical protein
VAVELIEPFNMWSMSLLLKRMVTVPVVPAKAMAALLLPVWVCEGFVFRAEPLFKVRIPASFHVLVVPLSVVFVLSIMKA